MRTSLPVPALRQAREHLLEHGACLAGAIDERIARSWRRSLAAGLAPGGRLADAAHACGGDLSQLLAGNRDLLAHSRPVMEHLFEQVRHTQSMVILADKRGTLMHTLGDADFLCKAERVALAPGASWHEQHRGTNAIGTALAEASGVEIHGAEHFLERNAFLTCAAAPIMSASGELAGILDISGDQRGRHPHTRGLVGMAARMIENRLLIAGCQRNIRVHLHPQAEGIGSIAEGIIVLGPDGSIVGANRNGLQLLRLAPSALGTTPLAGAVDLSLDQLLARARHDQLLPMQVTLHDGTRLFAQVHAEPAAARGAPPSAGREFAMDDALTRLDTGDLRWRSAADKARRVSGKPIPLLIQGESGVGKELFARATHDSGPRRGGPFVAINCAAVPENLIEAELFGYASGAYTGARREGSPGRMREAHGGTLLLDEIGDMPLAMQSRLLRVLQERQIAPLGGGRAVDVDFALICASHRNLRQAAEQGSFRSDLYYRINGLTLSLPALRERSDFLVLTRRLLSSLNPEREIELAPELLLRFCQHGWPGNLRQYANVLRTASAMLDPHEECIDWQHLPDDLAEELLVAPPQGAEAAPAAPQRITQNLKELSRAAVRQALEGSRGNISEAARRLGISRQTLYRKLND
ncbi:MAG: sigma-54-dependent Fis family transcriptional regulator [Sulfuritalea sp.]|nr:sigma-54-dependent Fis family transcriptional regulator [Sulfuritalea sp.]